MFTKLLLLLSFGLAFNASADLKPLIVGGSDAGAGEFPFIVSLFARGEGHVCGGSLIKKNWVLTAAHCLEGTAITKVYMGLLDLNDKRISEVRHPRRVIRHPWYNDKTTDYDFALIELDGDSRFTPIELNTEEIAIPHPNAPGLEVLATVAGWGERNQSFVPMAAPDILQKVEVPLVSSEVCNQAYKGAITARMLCAGLPTGGKDSCYGDSGGPMTAIDANGVRKLIGVVSWGEGCAQPNKFGVYSKVSSVTEWINSTAI